jgi:hypothetical protein
MCIFSHLADFFFSLEEAQSLFPPVTHVLNHVAVIADEEDRSTVGQVDLHADQTVGVAGQVVQSDALAEIEAAFVEGLPVPV